MLRTTHRHAPPALEPHELPQPVPKSHQHQPHADPREDDISLAHLRSEPDVLAELVDLVLRDASPDGAEEAAEHKEGESGAGKDGVGEERGTLAAGDEEQGGDGSE